MVAQLWRIVEVGLSENFPQAAAGNYETSIANLGKINVHPGSFG